MYSAFSLSPQTWMSIFQKVRLYHVHVQDVDCLLHPPLGHTPVSITEMNNVCGIFLLHTLTGWTLCCVLTQFEPFAEALYVFWRE